MIALLQRVTRADVTVGGECIAAIGRGLLVFAAVRRDDDERDARRLAERITGYRVFPDASGRMNSSLADQGAELLVVPQFTLAADTRKGTRASFSSAAPPEAGERLFGLLVQCLAERLDRVRTGRFGADMQIGLVNDGPVTFWLES